MLTLIKNNTNKVPGVALLISERADFRTRNIIQDKGGHYIMTKGSILQADIIILNVYVPNDRESRFEVIAVKTAKQNG